MALPQTASAETRWYAIGMQHLATHSDRKFGPGTNCPKGGNGQWSQAQIRILQFRYKYTAAKAKEVLSGEDGGRKLVNLRGLERWQARAHPGISDVDPQDARRARCRPQGRAYGFNLDGKGASRRDAMVDPETGAKDVENNLFRILGCYGLYDTNLPIRPIYEESIFIDGLAVMPAWLLSISGDNRGDDLAKDGPVTVTFAKALQHPLLGADGKPLRGQTYTLDPSNRNFGTLKGRMTNGEITAEGGEISLEGEAPLLTVWNMTNTHLRLKTAKDGSLGGYIGGFQPWLDYWFMQSAIRVLRWRGPIDCVLEHERDGGCGSGSASRVRIAGFPRPIVWTISSRSPCCLLRTIISRRSTCVRETCKPSINT